ncbi:hypothetical protein MMC25_002236 [Agyrium rufum]|nr:hypothetical protein [Agyrium rufum]
MKLQTFSAVASLAFASAQHQIPLANPASTALEIPLLGFGTWNLDKSNVSDAVSAAIQIGYRHIDGARAYGNEIDVGKGIASGLKAAGLKRSDIWVTSKLANGDHEPAQVLPAFERTRKDLGLEYLDLYLMHWPMSTADSDTKIDYLDTWHAMERLLATGKLRNIGVANFAPSQLATLIANSTVKPAVHQMELHPYLQQIAWIQYHAANGIHVTAYSPLANTNPTIGTPADENPPPFLLKNEVMTGIAKKDGNGCKTAATVALSWGMNRGTSVIPKSSHVYRMEENFSSLGCELEYADFKSIEGLGSKYLTRFINPGKRSGLPIFEGLDGV